MSKAIKVTQHQITDHDYREEYRADLIHHEDGSHVAFRESRVSADEDDHRIIEHIASQDVTDGLANDCEDCGES